MNPRRGTFAPNVRALTSTSITSATISYTHRGVVNKLLTTISTEPGHIWIKQCMRKKKEEKEKKW